MNYNITIPAGTEAMKLQSYLETDLKLSKKIRHQLRMTNGVALNQEVVNFHVTVTAGDQLTLTLSEEDFPKPTLALGQADIIEVLFEDEHLIIVNKPLGVKSHPNDPGENDTMMNHLAAYLADKNEAPYIVHRLDQETSGVMLFAKNPLILPVLDRLLESKKVKRQYQAIIDGRLPREEVTINEAIGRDRHDSRKRVITKKGGQTAQTTIQTDHKDDKFSYLLCELETGRTHQIRVHLESLSHPVVGDPLYHPQPNKADRMMLHSYHLSFTHPFSGESLDLSAEPGLW